MEAYFAGPGFRIEDKVCSGCGRCALACRFGAIHLSDKGYYSIVVELCERCGACVDRCHTKAIRTYEKQAGELFISETKLGIPLVHAELEPGEDTSGKLVSMVRTRAHDVATEDTVIVVDSPPGIGCPVIASLTGADLVLIIVEASASGIRDAGRLVELVSLMKRKVFAIINKTCLNTSMDDRARAMIADAGIPLAGEIPFDPELRSAAESGKTWLSIGGETGAKIKSALAAVMGILAARRRSALLRGNADIRT